MNKRVLRFVRISNWQLRTEALSARAALARGSEQCAQLEAWLELHASNNAILVLRCEHPFVSIIIVFAEFDLLPWFDGIAYAGMCPEAPKLWLPTHLVPDVPSTWLEGAALRQTGADQVLLWHDPPCLVALA